MDAFRFAPELFECRNEAMEALGAAGYQWLSDYAAVDPLHDVYGIEVCGISQKRDAMAILSILRELFPHWEPGCLQYKAQGREPGWKVRVQRDADCQRDDWRGS